MSSVFLCAENVKGIYSFCGDVKELEAVRARYVGCRDKRKIPGTG
jgi:hypothetical protein